MSPQRPLWLRRACLASAIALAGCCSVATDAFLRGEQELARGNLVAALEAFDAVAVTDLRYPEARLSSAALERRIGRYTQFLVEGLRLRTEWRDDEAAAAFRSALEVWPGDARTEQLLAATVQRRRALAGFQARSSLASVARTLAPPPAADAPVPVAVLRSETAAELAPGLPSASDGQASLATAEPAQDLDVAMPKPGQLPTANDAVGAELAQIEARLAAGEPDQVLGDLVALLHQAPADTRVTMRLARLLQQRGLVRYGTGHLAEAVADLQRATELDPALESARVLYRLAAKELATPPR